ncbi:MAG: hypothetical protein A3I66_13500 [Burkholderiales bacterium RIFCSPLOWO2_02_FULL_57_36]|nr:MAG: hypothetical protein A3I66_13500 [Burkholderiales bacterium RIFCSPLOWO2_02_FULL_57_36]
MKKSSLKTQRVAAIKPGLIKLGVGLALATALSTSFAEQTISGTYSVKFERMCVKSPYRQTREPAFFSFNTPEGSPNGYLMGPAGASYPSVANAVIRSSETGSYLMVVNPVNNTISISNGTYHAIPLTTYNIGGQAAFADFGTFSSSGTYVHARNSPYIDTIVESTAIGADGVNQSITTNTTARLETRDKGDSFYSLAGRGSIRLQHVVSANVYRDVHCTGSVTGTRVSRAH